MIGCRRRNQVFLILEAVFWLTVPVVDTLADSPRIDFDRDVRPILSDKCFVCHGPDEANRQADLRLDTREGLLAAAVIVPGDLDGSELVRRIRAVGDERMPPPGEGKGLTADEIKTLERWISAGAAWKGHWAFEPITRPIPPSVNATGVLRNPIDAFLMARWKAEKITPVEPADRVTLIRRVSFDLLGLPPTQDEVDAFVADTDENAFEHLVDRLMSSPHFGERLAVQWLDAVRYADTVGYHGDQERSVSPYRDYVIAAFNANMPYDVFTREQLAGDLLSEATLWQKVASGYNMLGMTTIEGGAQPGEYLTKYAADRVRTTSLVWLGLTFGCAECHDHKFDPMTMRDFYSLAAFFADLREEGYGNPVADLAVPTPQQAERIAHFDSEIAALQRGDISEEAKQQIAALEQQKAEFLQTVRFTIPTVSSEPREMKILPRGNWLDRSGETVEPAVPKFLTGFESSVEASRRLNRDDLATWLMSETNPLPSRVMVNRLWQIVFGKGLVRTLDDFGSQGDRPTHPELLDWLAAEFRDSGWDIKHIVRLMITSSAYRLSSTPTSELHEQDPENRLLARQTRRRLDAEHVRDVMLATSGLLVARLGGESARPYQPAGYYAYLNFPTREYVSDTNERQYRRGVYMHWQRTYLHPALIAFDAPSREECTADRPISHTPLSALVMLNDPSSIEAARVLAERTIRDGGDSFKNQLGWIFRIVLSREPELRERKTLAVLWQREHERYAMNPSAADELMTVGLSPKPTDLDVIDVAAWTSVARAIYNLNETITRY
ncbi:MAG: PSD1 and planctomycete cytochrome C domain-containing protein [Planctomycetota bacterium]|nr:PSD1 and planctomycete cytochrome C domain-containing protein [Planctomycetota bacterium]MDA1211181.1 PSD1 and planctomycete cytochrome C domain-containing protein [Planctomycetota bacterium]